MKRTVHAVAWVLLAVTAFVLWPQRWGGDMTYVLTTGTSMQPGFVAGDLAVLRAADSYEVGDVAAYPSAEIKQVVMHRVKTKDDGVLTFQGDNNDFVDPDRVTEQDVRGKLLLRVPKVGLALSWLLKPINLVLVAVGLFLLLGDRKVATPGEPAGPSPQAAPREPEQPITVRQVQLPPGTATADLVDVADLHRLAARFDRPVLRDETTGELLVHDGAMAYRWVEAQVVAPERGSGRDWLYGVEADVVAATPRPRRADAEIDYGLDLRRLRKVG